MGDKRSGWRGFVCFEQHFKDFTSTVVREQRAKEACGLSGMNLGTSTRMSGFLSVCFISEALNFVFILKLEPRGPCSCFPVSTAEPTVQALTGTQLSRCDGCGLNQVE